MTKNLYFRTVIRRENVIKNFLLDAFLGFSSYPRLLIEVFIRRNFGERYFSLASCITVGLILLAGPIVLHALQDFHPEFNGDNPNFWGHYTTWYLFLAAFGYFTFLRWKEVRRNPSVFDFRRYSLDSGRVHPFFIRLRVGKWEPTDRQIETLCEPAPVFVGGILLVLIGQPLGWVLLTASLFYCLGYVAAYNKGDNFIMDKIDEMILNEEMEHAFIGDEDAEKSRGVRFHARKPKSPSLRKKLAGEMVESDKVNEEVAYVE